MQKYTTQSRQIDFNKVINVVNIKINNYNEINTIGVFSVLVLQLYKSIPIV